MPAADQWPVPAWIRQRTYFPPATAGHCAGESFYHGRTAGNNTSPGVIIMTDKINFGGGLGPINRVGGPQKTVDAKPTADKGPVDRVDFSSVFQEVSRAREVSAPVDSERAQKLASLKAQIAEGSYRPDLEKVATSLIDFFSGVK